MSPAHRQVLALAYFRGYTQPEIATITGVPLAKLRHALAGDI